jgi:hypothetical protein
MRHRFFDIVIETESGDVGLGREFVLDIPESDLSTPVDRMEYLGLMMDMITAASGCAVCSFRSEDLPSSDFSKVGT